MLNPRVFLVIIIALAASLYSNAQPSDYFLFVNHQEVTKDSPLEIRAHLLRTGEIQEIYLMYRPFGSSEYNPVEMSVSGNSATAVIPADRVSPPHIEYYIKLISHDGSEHTYPVSDPEYNPEMAPVRSVTVSGDNITILSPQENETVEFRDLVISVSLFEVLENYDKDKTQVFIDGKDITSHTLFSDDILIAVPSNIDGLNLSSGEKTIHLTFREVNTGEEHSLNWNFNLTGSPAIGPITEDFRYDISMRGESRNETFGGTSTWYNRSTITFDGSLPWIRFRSNLHVTNEERSFRQPQNRYSFSAEMPWLRLHAGDTYPRFPSLIMNGRRLRGFFGELELGWFNLEYATGQTIRSVEGSEIDRISAFGEDGSAIQPPPNSTLVDDSTYALYSHGTHTRTLTAIRPSFGSRDFIQMGFTYLHSQDDIGSVEFGRRPAENLVVGSDLRVSLDRRRIEFTGEIAGSMQNTDISRGNLTREELEDLMGSEAVDQLEDIFSLSTLQSFITVNQYLVPFDPTELSSLAIDLNLRLNYFGNNFQFGYIRRGNDYNSFGLTALRRDVEGIRVRDRLRLMDNQLYFDVSVESLRDNLHDTKAHTTHFNRYDASVSYYPRRDLPSITVGYGYYKNDNNVELFEPTAIRDVTNRFFTQLAHNIFWGAHHNGSLSFNMSLRDDQTDRNADVDVYNIIAMINSRFDDMPLRTNIGLGVYHSKIPFFESPENENEQGRFVQTDFDYYNLILGGEVRLLGNDLILNASFIPTFGDYNRTVYQAGAQYYFMHNLSVVLQADYLVNPNNRDDMVSNLMLRYDI